MPQIVKRDEWRRERGKRLYDEEGWLWRSAIRITGDPGMVCSWELADFQKIAMVPIGSALTPKRHVRIA
jgi:hypothetical protein